MNEVINRMYEKKKQPYPESIAQKFVNNSQHCNTIIIVEGSSDEKFYKNTNIEILTNAFYIYANHNANIVGKKAVIEAYFKIKEYSRRNKFNNSVIFIVDKDFFGINWKARAYSNIAKEQRATNEDINNFTILNCHSHECYFILEDNLKQIFKLLHIEDKLDNFNNIFEENIDDFSEYFAYKSILEDENPNYARDCDNIKGIDFNFAFKEDKLTFNKKDMQSNIDKMKNEIKFSEKKALLVTQYLEMKQKLKTHPELLRGHTLFELLECYLKYYGKAIKNYKEYNNEIIKKMEIPLDIKVLKFDIGKYKLDETFANVSRST